MVPDTLGYNNGNFPVWEPLNGCVPQVLLGTDAQGVDHVMGTQCAGPDVRLKPIELAPDDCNPSVPEECVPYQWNQVYRSRPLTAFFDGSVRITTPREFRQADSRRGLSEPMLWMKTTPFGFNGVGGGQSADFLVRTSAHFLTTFGIAGRDTIAY